LVISVWLTSSRRFFITQIYNRVAQPMVLGCMPDGVTAACHVVPPG
jgi:hypothetical protein